MSALFTHEDDSTGEMWVFFLDDSNIGIKTIETYCKKMQEENASRAIIVVQTDLAPLAKQVSQFRVSFVDT